MTVPAERPSFGTSSPEGGQPRRWHEHTMDWRNGYMAGYNARPRIKASHVRWSPDGPEMRCDECADKGGVAAYWPLTPQFWDPRNVQRCRACNLGRKRAKAKAKYWADPETHRQRAIEYHELHRRVIQLKKRARYAEDPETYNVRSREYRAANVEMLRAYRRAYYAKNRDRILYREKLRRAGVIQAAA